LGQLTWDEVEQALANNAYAKYLAHTMSALPTQCTACRALAISALLKDAARLEQERAAFANKRQVYKGFSREQLSNGAVQRTHSADSMDGPYSSANASHSRQQVILTLVPTKRTCYASCALLEQVLAYQPCSC